MTLKQKRLIPNILTIARIILTIIIIILGLTSHIKLVIFLTILAAITDFLDGKLARMWNVTSLTGAKLDAVADKFFAIGLIACLTNKIHLLYIPLIIEVILSGANLYFHFKSGKTKSLMIGKIKTWVLFASIIFAILSILSKSDFILNIANGLIYITINLQVLSIIKYTLYYKSNTKKEKIEDKQLSSDDELEKTVVVDNLNDLINDVLVETDEPRHMEKEIDEIMDKYNDNDIDDIL